MVATPVAWWTFDDADTSGTTIGSTVTDKTGNGHTGTFAGTGPITSVTGQVNQARSFPVTAEMAVTNAADINGNTMSMCCWIKGSPAAAFAKLMTKFDFVSKGWLIQQNNLAADLHVRIDTSGGANQSTSNLTGVLDGTWHFIAFVVDSSGNWRAYKDGNAALTGTYVLGTGIGSTQDFSLAFDNFAIAVDELKLFNVALVDADVAALFAGTTTITVTLDDLFNAPLASLTSLHWAWWDVTDVNSITGAPVVKGTTGATNGSGSITLTLTGTTLTTGQSGMLMIHAADMSRSGLYKLAVT